jgi:hypothetical protein
MSLNPLKYIFGVSSGKLLGHVVFDYGISIDPERVKAIQNLIVFSLKKGIQSFMEKINFIRGFILDSSKMVKTIHNLLRKTKYFPGPRKSKKPLFK